MVSIARRAHMVENNIFSYGIPKSTERINIFTIALIYVFYLYCEKNTGQEKGEGPCFFCSSYFSLDLTFKQIFWMVELSYKTGEFLMTAHHKYISLNQFNNAFYCALFWIAVLLLLLLVLVLVLSIKTQPNVTLMNKLL